MARTLPIRFAILWVACISCLANELFADDVQSDHWAYRPIVRPEPPRHEIKAVRNVIDRFVGQQLKVHRKELAPGADRVTLIRRTSFDLIGLPPTIAQVEQFVGDKRPDAYERLVDRLLASPHYGERWARPWLDLCHYADTDGYLTDQDRPVAWRYRAWLVDTLNENMPFDQFTIEQLAGDLLPNATTDQRIATGFLRQTLSNREGGAELEEFRVKQVIDRTSMLGEVWMGLTVGCAQCHDHKYDAISQDEFFELYAFFNDADEINIDAPLEHERVVYEASLPGYQRQRQKLLAPLLNEIDELQQRWETKLLHARANPGDDWYWDRQWELLGLVWGGNLGEGQLEGCQIVLVDRSRRTQLQRDRLLDYFLPKADTIDAAKAKELKLAALNGELRKLTSSLPPVTRAPTMMQTQTPRTTTVHNGGDFRDPGYVVAPGVPAALPALSSESRGRRALAEWLVSREHPLTARVIVNRMWQEFFGRGLVETAGDFGVRGTPPTHPKLLDWLACEFIESGWNVKHLHRLIVTSSTYRQASIRDSDSTFDPDNRWLSRQSARRLSAEQIRDAALRSSGLWDARVGGPSVKPPQPDSVVEQSYHNTWQPSEGGDRYRRGLYTYVQRTSPFAMHITFDAPNPNHICTGRVPSNTPLQALTLLNDPVFFEAAQTLAQRVIAISSDNRERITAAFASALARKPTEKEIDVLSNLLTQLQSTNDPPQQVWTVLCSVIFNTHEFVTRN